MIKKVKNNPHLQLEIFVVLAVVASIALVIYGVGFYKENIAYNTEEATELFESGDHQTVVDKSMAELESGDLSDEEIETHTVLIAGAVAKSYETNEALEIFRQVESLVEVKSYDFYVKYAMVAQEAGDDELKIYAKEKAVALLDPDDALYEFMKSQLEAEFGVGNDL